MARELRIDHTFPEGEWYVGEAGYMVMDFATSGIIGNGSQLVFDKAVEQLAVESWLPLRIQIFEEEQYSSGMYTAVVWAAPATYVEASAGGDAIEAGLLEPATIAFIARAIVAGVITIAILMIINSMLRTVAPVLYNVTGGPLSFLWPLIIGIGIVAVAYVVITQPARRTGLSEVAKGTGSAIASTGKAVKRAAKKRKRTTTTTHRTTSGSSSALPSGLPV